MSEEIPAILSEPASSADSAEGLGQALRAAREKSGLDVEDAARKLCLSSRQLTALEANELGALPSPAFTRGFIRNYARLLNLNPDPLLDVYRNMLPRSAEESVITLHSEGIPIQIGDRKTWMPYLMASILIGVVGGAWMAYMEWSERQTVAAGTTVSAKPEKPVPIPPTAPTPAPEAVSPLATEMPLAPVEPSVNTQTEIPASSKTPTVAALPARSQVAISFTQQSWVRITDREGKEIFSKTRPGGSEELAEGQPPFKIDIGNAAGVQLSYNGRPVDLVPHTKANVARLTLE